MSVEKFGGLSLYLRIMIMSYVLSDVGTWWHCYLGRRHEVKGPSFVPFLEVWVTQKWGGRSNHEF